MPLLFAHTHTVIFFRLMRYTYVCNTAHESRIQCVHVCVFRHIFLMSFVAFKYSRLFVFSFCRTTTTTTTIRIFKNSTRLIAELKQKQNCNIETKLITENWKQKQIPKTKANTKYKIQKKQKPIKLKSDPKPIRIESFLIHVCTV